MKIIDNFDLIKPLLKFEKDKDKTDYFYYVEILMRKKEHPELKHSTKIKTFRFITEEKYDEYKSIIKTLCNRLNARAYIRLNRRSHFRVSSRMYKLMGELSENKQFGSFNSVYSKACGQTKVNDDTWVVDIDTFDRSVIDYIRNKIEHLQQEDKKHPNKKILLEVPTKNGIHIITNSFRVDKFRGILKKSTLKDFDIDLHKNNPTILYMIDDENS